MGLLALHHHPHAKEPGWGFPGSQEMLSQQQLCSPPAASLPRQTHRAELYPCPPLPGEAKAAGATNSWSHP